MYLWSLLRPLFSMTPTHVVHYWIWPRSVDLTFSKGWEGEGWVKGKEQTEMSIDPPQRKKRLRKTRSIKKKKEKNVDIQSPQMNSRCSFIRSGFASFCLLFGSWLIQFCATTIFMEPGDFAFVLSLSLCLFRFTSHRHTTFYYVFPMNPKRQCCIIFFVDFHWVCPVMYRSVPITKVPTIGYGITITPSH